jgi:hypothetical protein
MEFCIASAPEAMSKATTYMVNQTLEKHMSGFRAVGGQIVPITSEEEITSIESAIGTSFLMQVLAHISSPLYRAATLSGENLVANEVQADESEPLGFVKMTMDGIADVVAQFVQGFGLFRRARLDFDLVKGEHLDTLFNGGLKSLIGAEQCSTARVNGRRAMHGIR